MLLAVLCLSCKKEHKSFPAPVYNVIGSWALSSYQTNFGGGVNATVAQYPCMAYNTLQFFDDSTSTQYYTGIDTCFITPSHLKADGAQTYGLPGIGQLNSKWTLKGNILHLTYTSNNQTLTGVITTVNKQLQLTFKDTVTSGANTYYITSVEVQL